MRGKAGSQMANSSLALRGNSGALGCTGRREEDWVCGKTDIFAVQHNKVEELISKYFS